MACIEVCPHKAISEKKEEFSFPVIDERKCRECKLCERVCPIHNVDVVSDFNQMYYAFSNKDEKEKELSTSGGAFYKLACAVLEQNGYVCGAVLDEDLELKHLCVNDIETIKKMRGSKYLQSNISGCFSQIADKLLHNITVLFSGTPCQCDAVKKFIKGKNISDTNLILCDLICHGVVSPKVFADYISFCENKAGKKIIYHNFRKKINGWHAHVEENVFEDGSRDCKTYESQLYKKIFYSHLALRESCFTCEYATLNRVSDITIGDYWGIEKYHPELDDDKGTSLLIINSQKGKALFESLKNVNKTQLKQMEIFQPQLQHPAQKPKKYSRFWKIYTTKGFKTVIIKYYNYGTLGKVYHSFKYLKRVAKRMYIMLREIFR